METLQKTKNALSDPKNQVKVLSESSVTSFSSVLKEGGQFPLKANYTEILQINIGKLCNQVCTHCHVDAGPDRKENMTREVLEACLMAVADQHVHTVDITGGAPEMNPHFRWFVEKVSKLGKKVIVRSNLTILTYKNYLDMPQFFADNKVTVISSLPCYTAGNVDKQRGNGVFKRSIEALQRLNEVGYGKEGSGLELDLVFNPGGASLPPSQSELEADYKVRLKEDFGIEFNQLFAITNLPISRFLEYLINEDKYENYMQLLLDSFNSSALSSVMCKNTLSVDWQGNVYDCDFNQMLGLPVAGKSPSHIRDFNQEKLAGRNVVLGNHCFGCTAGEGSSCQGVLV